jgi:hypothetical protein
MSFDKNEKDCINGIPLIEIQENQNYFYFYTGLLLKSKSKCPKKGAEQQELIILSTICEARKPLLK